MKEEGLTDYMKAMFSSKELTENDVSNLANKHDKGISNSSNLARTIGFEPIIDPNSSLMKQVESERNAESANITTKQLDYMDRTFGDENPASVSGYLDALQTEGPSNNNNY
jgi:hypothetical protein